MNSTAKWGIVFAGTVVSLALAGKAIYGRSGGVTVSTPGVRQASSKKSIVVETTLDSTGVSERETNLGNLIADAVRDSGQAELALVPADEVLLVQIPPGDAAPAQIVKALRYSGDSSDTVVILDLTGTQIIEAVERGVSRAPKPFDGFLQVSGVKVRYTIRAFEKKSVAVTDMRDNPIDPKRTYRVATTQPMANGGLGYFKIWDKNKSNSSNTKISIAKSVEDYVTAQKTINATVEGRISQQ